MQVDDGGREGFFFSEDGQSKRGHHEYSCDDDGELAEKIGRAAASEDCLARSAEGRSDFGSLTGLQKNATDHEEASDEMNDDYERMHGTPISEQAYSEPRQRL